MDLRKLHNQAKREFVQEYRGAILDAGCGCGGDLFKWNSDTVIYACDPDTQSLAEAKKRSKKLSKPPHFFNGDISATPIRAYDVICYNFSIQYTFAAEDIFRRTLECIRARSAKGTVLIGVVPDSEELMLHTGSLFTKRGNFTGDFGDHVQFFIEGAPYYKNGPVSEPVCYKDILITELERIGFALELWSPFISFTTGDISDLYAKFIFRRVS